MRLAALACLLFALLGAGCGTEEQSAPRETTAADGPAADRRPAPAITGESLTGQRIALHDFRGRPLLINVWSSW